MERLEEYIFNQRVRGFNVELFYESTHLHLDAKRTYLRRKHTTTKKVHFTEGWVEFRDKKVARSIAEMLNAQPIGGKKGTRWRDDVWTMKYLPKFKWSMLTEQIGQCFLQLLLSTSSHLDPIAHEAAVHTARLRVELSQSRREQQEYLKNVELARVLDKRAQKKQQNVGEGESEKAVESMKTSKRERLENDKLDRREKKRKKAAPEMAVSETQQKQLHNVLGSIF